MTHPQNLLGRMWQQVAACRAEDRISTTAKSVCDSVTGAIMVMPILAAQAQYAFTDAEVEDESLSAAAGRAAAGIPAGGGVAGDLFAHFAGGNRSQVLVRALISLISLISRSIMRRSGHGEFTPSGWRSESVTFSRILSSF
jgi:hypothetical protein